MRTLGGLRLLGLVLVVLSGSLVLAAACGGGDEAAGNGQGTAVAQSEGGEQAVTVVASDRLRFEPARVVVKAGQPVHLTFDNSQAKTLHDFTVDAMPAEAVRSEGDGHEMHDGQGMGMGDATAGSALHVAAEAGHRGTMTFTPAEPGEYEFYCSVPGHREAGMQGTIVVQ